MYKLQSSSSLGTDLRSQPASELTALTEYTYDGLSIGSIGLSRAPDRIWKPRILKLPVIFSTVLLLLAIIAALEAFVRLSHSRSGFAVPEDGVRWLLTYGPIVGFVCMGLVWKSWELEVKKLMPWADMRTKPIPAKDSILLDYVGVNYVEVLWIAVKHKHWSVLLAILGSGLLAISNIAATSLWAISFQPVQQHAQLLRTTTFEKAFNPEATTYLANYFGHLLYGVPPKWTFGNHALSSFQPVDDHASSGIFSAVTHAYSATLSCETMILETGVMYNDTSSPPFHLTLSATASWGECQQAFNVSGFGAGGTRTALIGRVDDMVCGGSHTAVISIFHSDSANVLEKHAIACQPRYTRSELSVNINGSTSEIDGVPTILSSTPVTLPDGDGLAYWLHHSNPIDDTLFAIRLDWDQNDFSDPWTWPHDVLLNSTNDISHPGTWINLLGRARNITDRDVLDPIRLGNLSADVFQEIFPYVAHSAYALPSHEALDGTLTLSASRIFTKDPSIRVVQAALCVLVVITIAIYILRPITHLAEDPGSILTSAALLASSRPLASRLASTGAMSEKELEMHLKSMSCTTFVDGRGVLTVHAADRDHLGAYSVPLMHPSGNAELPGSSFWRPLMLALPFRVAIVAFLAGSIAAVEVLHRRSERDRGLVDLIGQTALEHYSWTYLAPAILFLLGLALASVDSAIRVTEPFRIMASSPQPARILNFNPNFASAFTLLPRSIRHREYFTASIGLTALLLPIAKIVLAGLLINGEVDVSKSMTLRLNTQFKEVFNTSLDFGLWAFVEDPAYNLTRPFLTTNTYAVASTQLPADNITGSVTARMPVAYSTLGSCKHVESTLTTGSAGRDSIRLVLSFLDYPTCPSTEYYLDLKSYLSSDHFAFVLDDPLDGDDPRCKEQMHFIVWRMRGINDRRPERITHLACDWNVTTSSMTVTMANGPNPTILNVDAATELDKTIIPVTWTDTNNFWRGKNFTLMLPNTMTDPFFTGLFGAQRATNISAYLEPDYLEKTLRRDWSSFWALQFHQKMRVSTDKTVTATRMYRLSRLFIATGPARILQGLLGTILIIVFSVCVLTPMRSVLPKPPCSIAAQMSLIASSRLVRRIGEGGSLDGLLVRLSWWRDENVEGGERYGIDIVEQSEEDVPLSNYPKM